MKKLLLCAAVLALAGCAGQAPQPDPTKLGESAETAAASAPADDTCVAPAQLSKDEKPMSIAHRARTCVDQENYSQAAELVMVASAFAFYDTQRVAGVEPRSALDSIFTEEFDGVSDEKKQKLFAAFNTLNQNARQQQQVCSYLNVAEPPSYYPEYMIAKATDGNDDQSLVSDFDADKTWDQTLIFVRCAAPQGSAAK